VRTALLIAWGMQLPRGDCGECGQAKNQATLRAGDLATNELVPLLSAFCTALRKVFGCAGNVHSSLLQVGGSLWNVFMCLYASFGYSVKLAWCEARARRALPARDTTSSAFINCLARDFMQPLCFVKACDIAEVRVPVSIARS
jgi:hypothetical protein